jgi:hypothetical protein
VVQPHRIYEWPGYLMIAGWRAVWLYTPTIKKEASVRIVRESEGDDARNRRATQNSIKLIGLCKQLLRRTHIRILHHADTETEPKRLELPKKGQSYKQQLKFAGGHPPNYYAADLKLK